MLVILKSASCVFSCSEGSLFTVSHVCHFILLAPSLVGNDTEPMTNLSLPPIVDFHQHCLYLLQAMNVAFPLEFSPLAEVFDWTCSRLSTVISYHSILLGVYNPLKNTFVHSLAPSGLFIISVFLVYLQKWY